MTKMIYVVHTLSIEPLIFKSIILVWDIFFPVRIGQEDHGGTRVRIQMYNSWDKAQINNPLNKVLQTENPSKEDDNKDIQVSRQNQSFEEQKNAIRKYKQKSKEKKEREKHLTSKKQT